MPVYFDFFAPVNDILVTTLGICQPRPKVFLLMERNRISWAQWESQVTHFGNKLLVLGLNVRFVQLGVFFHVGKAIDFERVLRVKWMIMDSRECNVCLICIAKIDKEIACYTKLIRALNDSDS